MNTQDIVAVINKDKAAKKLFCGVYATDTLPIPTEKDHFFIVNTQASHQPGEHWQLVFKRGSICYFFCSLGRKPKGAVLKYLKYWPKFVVSNGRPQYSGIACGGFCIFVALMMSRGHSLKTLDNFFKILKNDSVFIRYFMKRAFNFNFH